MSAKREEMGYKRVGPEVKCLLSEEGQHVKIRMICSNYEATAAHPWNVVNVVSWLLLDGGTRIHPPIAQQKQSPFLFKEEYLQINKEETDRPAGNLKNIVHSVGF